MNALKAFSLALLVSISSLSLVRAQTGKQEVIAESDDKPNFNQQQADRLYKKGEFYEAIPFYQKALNKENNRLVKADILFKTGECYRRINDPKDAMKWYTDAIRAGFDRAIVLLYLADAQKSLGKYDDALANYKEYIRAVEDDPRGLNGIKACELSRQWVAKPTKHAVINLAALNTKYMDFAVSFAKKNSRVLVFTSARSEAMGSLLDGWTGQKYTDLFQVTRDDRGKWTEPIPLPSPINTNLTEGAACFDKTGSLMYFTKCIPASTDADGHCNIYIVRRKGDVWGDPQPLKIVADSFNIGHPALSPDEKSLYFAANIPGGYGGKDIYVSYKKDGKWGKPINLGPKVNTNGDEVYPYVKSDGTLYFSSNGLTGMGGLDIFKVKNLGPADITPYLYNTNLESAGKTVQVEATALPDAVPSSTVDSAGVVKPAPVAVDSLTYFTQLWTEPENLKFPINSSYDDFAITFDESDITESGYLSSTREGGKGSDDIWSFRVPPLEFTIQGKVLDVDNRGGIKGALVELLGNDGSLVTVKTDRRGNYIFDKTMVKPNTVYKLTASSKDYLSAKGIQTTVGLTQNTDLFQDAFLLKSTKRPIELRNIFYDLDKASLRPESKLALDSLIEIMGDNPKLVIRINSHTDSRATDEYNLDLSQRRAQSVVDYLTQHGIPQARLVAKGWGESKLKISDDEIAKAKTEAEKEALHQQNRRTEFEKLRDDYVPESDIQETTTSDGKRASIVSKPMLSSKDSAFFGLKEPKKEQPKPAATPTEVSKPASEMTAPASKPKAAASAPKNEEFRKPAENTKPVEKSKSTKKTDEDEPQAVPSPER